MSIILLASWRVNLLERINLNSLIRDVLRIDSGLPSGQFDTSFAVTICMFRKSPFVHLIFFYEILPAITVWVFDGVQ